MAQDRDEMKVGFREERKKRIEAERARDRQFPLQSGRCFGSFGMWEEFWPRACS